MKFDISPYRLKIASNDAEIKAAQGLRYKVFVEEMGAQASAKDHIDRLERDEYDRHFEHILLIDETCEDPIDQVIGVYRVMTDKAAAKGIGFYSKTEFDLSGLQATNRSLLELGRSCVHKDHRGGKALHILWNGLADYIRQSGSEILFGTASFPGIDPQKIENSLSYLHHYHSSEPALQVKANDAAFVEMNRLPKDRLDRRAAVSNLPPLLKAYLRIGGRVAHGAWLDKDFNTIDVCLIVDLANIPRSQMMLYSDGAIAE